MDRLLTAYQEELLSLDELRHRMPALRQRENAMQAELQSIVDQVNDKAAFLRLAETLSALLTRLRASAGTLDVHERQRVVRLLVREILVARVKRLGRSALRWKYSTVGCVCVSANSVQKLQTGPSG
jgi:site-specific DNA recombinase